MNNQLSFSANTQNFLTRSGRILSNMICGVQSAPGSNSVSANYITQVVPIQRSCASFCRNCLRFTTNLTLQRICEGIIDTQSGFANSLSGIYRNCPRTVSSPAALTSFNAAADGVIDDLFTGIEQARTVNSIDCTFINQCIPCLTGIIDLSRAARTSAVVPSLVSTINETIETCCYYRRSLRELRSSLSCQ